jgi:hypothetical protein
VVKVKVFGAQKMLDARSVGGGRAANQAVDLVPNTEQKLGQVTSVLARYARD